MNISISPETEKLLEEQMKRHGYASADDAIRTALEVADRAEVGYIEDLDEQTLAAIEEGLAQAERGEGRPWEDVRREIKARFIRE